MNEDKFGLQVIAKGAFVDHGAGDGNPYMVETTTVRLNHVALNDWIMSECFNTRDCYEDGPEGDCEWKAHRAERTKRRNVWKAKILEALEIDSTKGGVSITQAQTEVFTVVHIQKMEGKTMGLEAFYNAGDTCIVLARSGDTVLIVRPSNRCAPFVVPLEHKEGAKDWWQGHYFDNLAYAWRYYQEAIS